MRGFFFNNLLNGSVSFFNMSVNQIFQKFRRHDIDLQRLTVLKDLGNVTARLLMSFQHVLKLNVAHSMAVGDDGILLCASMKVIKMIRKLAK